MYYHNYGSWEEELISFLIFIPIFILFILGKHRLLLIFLYSAIALALFFDDLYLFFINLFWV